MNKKILLWAFIFIFALSGSVTVLGSSPLRVTVNGESVFFPDTQPAIINDRTYVPVRFVAETIGAQVDWLPETQTATITRDQISLSVKIGNDQLLRYEDGAFVSGIVMDIAPLIADGRTMLPIRYIVEEFLYTVDWDAETATVSINESHAGQTVAPSLRAVLAPVVTYGLDVQSSSANFVYYTTASVKKHIPHISGVLENAYTQLSAEFGVKLNTKVAVRIFPDYKSFGKAAEKEIPPDVTADRVFRGCKNGHNDGTDGIYITPPNNTILSHSERFYDKMLVGGLVLTLAEYITTGYDLQHQNFYWLSRGLADYKSGELTRAYARQILESAVADNTIPSFTDLEVSDNTEFVAIDGDTYGASIIEFIDQRYGFVKVTELYRNPGEYSSVFGISKSEFEKQWQQYLRDHYQPQLDPVVTYDLNVQSSSENFVYYTTETIEKYIPHISHELERACKQLSKEFGVELNAKVPVRIFQNYRSFCEATEQEVLPNVTTDYIFGFYKSGYNGGPDGIYMTPPNDIVLSDPEDSYDKVLRHELIHALAEHITKGYELQKKKLHWLLEGLAEYKSGIITQEYTRMILESAVEDDLIPSLQDLEISDIAMFEELGGYSYGASIIEFIDQRYDFAKVLALYRNPGEYISVFGISKSEFEKQWQQFLRGHY